MVKNVKQQIIQITEILKKIDDIKDEYLYYDEKTMKANFKDLLGGYEGTLKGLRILLKKIKEQKGYKQ